MQPLPDGAFARIRGDPVRVDLVGHPVHAPGSFPTAAAVIPLIAHKTAGPVSCDSEDKDEEGLGYRRDSQKLAMAPMLAAL